MLLSNLPSYFETIPNPTLEKKGRIFAFHNAISMPYQSTKKQYKSRRERKQEHNRRLKIIIIFAVVLILFLILKDWREHYAYLKTYFM